MNNLARIVSHGFAIVVVILLGIGFIYRGQLFPDLELPDFLLPESAKVAGSGEKPADVLPGRKIAVEAAADEAARAPVFGGGWRRIGACRTCRGCDGGGARNKS